tara:strand:- start:258 stop:521 length:264 start_codon:yes stop_codon:yes gene_type:complete
MKIKKSVIKYSKITQSIASFLVLLKDHKKSAQFLFDMVDDGFKEYEEEEDEEKVENLRLFVLDIVMEISKIDNEYADSMAVEYFNLV